MLVALMTSNFSQEQYPKAQRDNQYQVGDLGLHNLWKSECVIPHGDSQSLEDYFGIQVPQFLRGVKLKPSYFVQEEGSNAEYCACIVKLRVILGHLNDQWRHD